MRMWIRDFSVARRHAGSMTVDVGPSFAYDVIEVQHGGTVEGTIRLDGAVPEPKGFNLITFPDPAYCGRISNGRGWRLLRDFVVNQAWWVEGCSLSCWKALRRANHSNYPFP